MLLWLACALAVAATTRADVTLVVAHYREPGLEWIRKADVSRVIVYQKHALDDGFAAGGAGRRDQV